jgi:Fe-S cluster biogenesis protein NfuA
MVLTDKEHLIERIEEAVLPVRPHLVVDGGDIEIVDVTDDMIVLIRWMGMCESCTMSEMTLRAGIEGAIKSKIPEIMGVQAINNAI